MAEARLPAALKAHGAAGTDGGSDRTLVGEVPFRVGALNGQIGTVEAMSRQEDWLHVVAADPAFWLKEVAC